MELTSRHLSYNESELCLDSIPLRSVLSQSKTPLYVYSLKKITAQAELFLSEARRVGLANPLPCYALKANPHPEILQALSALGFGADIVSGGELERALAAGFAPDDIVFSGVGKTVEELRAGLKVGIGSFNVESADELEELKRLGRDLKVKANVAFRFNPEVKPKTHHAISTGETGHKFGMSEREIKAYLTSVNSLDGVKLVGLSMHIGSQLTEMDATLEACHKLIELARSSVTTLEFLDIGGGLGIDYLPEGQNLVSVTDYMEALAGVLLDAQKQLNLKRIVFEPGRYIVGASGVLLTSVVRTKTSSNRRFVVVDAGMNTLMRPALYEAYHHMLPLTLDPLRPSLEQSIVGPICETTDTFAWDRLMSELNKGDIIALLDAGAYGASMSNDYNLRGLPSEIVLR
jgi:diaminopimelate decarboxylase